MSRRLIFVLMILIGIAAGLYYGWVYKPSVSSNNPLTALRQDYKTDYVLMTSEVYNKDGDLKLAADRLAQLGGASPIQTTLDAVVYARSAGYSINDLELITNLAKALQASLPAASETQP